MSLDQKARMELRVWILQTLEGAITPDDMDRLADWLLNSKDARDYYFEIIEFNNLLQDIEPFTIDSEPAFDDSGVLNRELLTELLKFEQQAPAISTPEKIQPAESGVEKQTLPKKKKRRVSRFIGLKFALGSIAALLLVSLVLHWVPQRIPVAHVVACKDITWLEGQTALQPGDILYSTDGSCHLGKGYLTLEMYCGAEVYVEGPAVFSGRDEKILYLHEGRACAFLPVQGSQFTIQTPTSDVTDLGTEFGVHVNRAGTTTAQVYEGQAEVSTQSKRHGSQKKILEYGMASQVDAMAGRLNPAPYDATAFVRYVDPQSGFVWHGDPIDLADVLATGNGFQTGIPNAGLSVTTGAMGIYQTGHLLRGTDAYISINDNPFVDGIFVVCGPGQTISTTGITSTALPSTGGMTWGGLIRHQDASYQAPITEYVRESASDGALNLSSNTGITFDIHAIVQTTPWLRIKGFAAQCYTPEKNTYANVSVLVDGRMTDDEGSIVTSNDIHEIDLALEPEARFLTLIVTVENNSLNQAKSVVFFQPHLDVERQIVTME